MTSTHGQVIPKTTIEMVQYLLPSGEACLNADVSRESYSLAEVGLEVSRRHLRLGGIFSWTCLGVGHWS